MPLYIHAMRGLTYHHIIKHNIISCIISYRAMSTTITNVTSSRTKLKQTPKTFVATAAMTESPITSADHDTKSEVEKLREAGFWFRKWDMFDLSHLLLLIVKHTLAVCSPFVLTWGAFWVTVILSFFSGMGITLCYHRVLTHRSLKLPKWLEYFFAYCGLHAGQRDPIFWVSVHKYHHKYTDTERDPHSPLEGFWFSHIGWFHYNEYLAVKFGESKIAEYANVPELKAQWFYRFLHDTYVFQIALLGAILYILGGFPWLAWGMGMRAVMVNHFTFFAASICHRWGERPWNTLDTSTNNWWVAMLTFGEGWHNNHHAFPYSARHGMEWWQFDATWELIKFLEMLGLAKDVKLPSEAEIKRQTKLCAENPKQSMIFN